ncbi:MAG: YgjV family protein [Clostridia bacterium]|nr:YgjV family protein [Clostridia bacterium]
MNSPLYWIAQGFGVVAVTMSLIIYQRKTRKGILTFKTVQDLSWLTHYLLIAAFPAAATSALCLCRAFVFYNQDKKFGKSILWLPFFIILYAVSAVLTWSNIFSIFPAISSSLSTVAFWMKEPRHTKMLAILASLCTLIYNIMQAHSITVYIGVTFTITSALVSLLMPLFRKKDAEDKTA